MYHDNLEETSDNTWQHRSWCGPSSKLTALQLHVVIVNTARSDAELADLIVAINAFKRFMHVDEKCKACSLHQLQLGPIKKKAICPSLEPTKHKATKKA